MPEAKASYFVVDLTATSVAPTPEDVTAQRAFLQKLADAGDLVLSGPLLDTPGRGMAILKAASREDIQSLYLTAPFVQKGLATFAIRAIDLVYGTALK